jgi:phosphatidylinositol glycan class W
VHQIALSPLGLTQYVRTAPRLSVISANKEGLASLPGQSPSAPVLNYELTHRPGYLAIYLLGLATGTIVLPPTPSFFRRLLTQRASPADLSAPRQRAKTATELASYAIVWWALLGVTSLLLTDTGVSRQTANFPYALWIAAFNTSFLLGYLTLDMLFFPKSSPMAKSARAPSTSEPAPPVLLAAINHNALPLFLLANVGTGVVNLGMRTMYAGAAVSMGVLALYALVVCGAAWQLRGTRVWRL